jgi:hypothetical protein
LSLARVTVRDVKMAASVGGREENRNKELKKIKWRLLF